MPVEDSYFTLHVKSRLFMKWTLARYQHQWNHFNHENEEEPLSLRYVVMIDDDAYIRLPQLLSVLKQCPGVRDYRGEVCCGYLLLPLNCIIACIPLYPIIYFILIHANSNLHLLIIRVQVFADKFNHRFKPIRDPDHRNYISAEDYPDAILPRYATGNFYMLSVDLVHYIATRGDDIRTIGTLEDVSMAVWLSNIAVSGR